MPDHKIRGKSSVETAPANSKFGKNFGGGQFPTNVSDSEVPAGPDISQASGRARSIINRLNAALRKTVAFDQTVYKRLTISTGGDALIGRVGQIANTDTLLSPQPLPQRLGRQRVSGEHVNSATFQSPSGKTLVADDWQILLSPSVVSRTELESGQLSFVFKDGLGAEEVLRILDFDTTTYQSDDVMFVCYCRSVGRATN